MRPALTYSLIMSAGLDAGNRSARKAGRESWSREDWQAACDVTAPLLSLLERDTAPRTPGEPRQQSHPAQACH